MGLEYDSDADGTGQLKTAALTGPCPPTYTHTHTHTHGSARDSCRCSGPASKLTELKKRSLLRSRQRLRSDPCSEPGHPGPGLTSSGLSGPGPARGRFGADRAWCGRKIYCGQPWDSDVVLGLVIGHNVRCCCSCNYSSNYNSTHSNYNSSCAGTGHRTCSVTIRPTAHLLQARDRSVTARDQSVINSKPVIGP